MKKALCLASIVLGLMSCPLFGAVNSSTPMADPVLEAPTLHSLGAYWIIRGDDNKNASVDVSYRQAGQTAWKKGMPLFRVEKAATRIQKHDGPVKVPADAWMFAGSIVLLAPDTQYEIKLNLVDADGGKSEKILKSRTIAEPVAPKGLAVAHVGPGNGGGNGTPNNPYKGLAEADKNAKPGMVFMVHKGTYAPFRPTASGQSGKPIIYMGAGDGEAVIDGGGKGRLIDMPGIDHVWFEKLSIRNGGVGIWAPEASNIVIRRCHISKVEYGIKFNVNEKGSVANFFVSDNTIEGPCAWPRKHGIENPRGMELTGQGHVVCYNRISGFADAVDTFPSPNCSAIDIHNNDISEQTDDGIEMDYSDRNTRCFNNRITNAFQGISVQPIYGGPVYIFRNAMYNICIETFKMHNNSSGALMMHNTSVKSGEPLVLWTPAEVRNCVFRNNLFIGSKGTHAYDCTAPMTDCDFDFDGFGGQWDAFLRWNDKTYKTLDDVRKKAPVYNHATQVDANTVFASGMKAPADKDKQFEIKLNDLRLKKGTPAIDAGTAVPNISDGFSGKAPDLGAYELGSELPHYGPRPENAAGAGKPPATQPKPKVPPAPEPATGRAPA